MEPIKSRKGCIFKIDPTGTIGFSNKVVDLNLQTCPDTGCINRPNCYFNDRLLGKNTEGTKCCLKSKMKFVHNNNNASNLIIMIVGNGKTEDSLEWDQKTPAALLFARAVSIGGMQLQFKKDSIKASFFDKDEEFEFKTKSADCDYLPVLNDYVNFKLNGDNISKTKPFTILPFDYKRHNDLHKEKEIHKFLKVENI